MIKFWLLQTAAGILKMGELMSQKEARRAQVLDLLKEGVINAQEASKRMGVSPRQVRRIVRRYQSEGLAGLISKKRGRTSHRRLDEALRATAVEFIGAHYRDFGPTLACEKLKEHHQITLSVESTRQLMMAAGYWRPRKGSTICTHPMRERPARFGEMIQIDGSPHDGFEGRSARCDSRRRWLCAGSWQDRLVKEMRRVGINNMEHANAWLPAFIADYNRRFAVSPRDASDAHLAYCGTAEALARTEVRSGDPNTLEEPLLSVCEPGAAHRNHGHRVGATRRKDHGA